MAQDSKPADLSGGAPVDTIPQVGESRSETLIDAGYRNVRDVQRADISDLVELFDERVARVIKENAGDVPKNPPDMTTAKRRARQQPDAKAKMVRVGDQQVAKVLESVESKNVGGAHMTVRKG